jgi:hypothetical protein
MCGIRRYLALDLGLQLCPGFTRASFELMFDYLF